MKMRMNMVWNEDANEKLQSEFIHVYGMKPKMKLFISKAQK